MTTQMIPPRSDLNKAIQGAADYARQMLGQIGARMTPERAEAHVEYLRQNQQHDDLVCRLMPSGRAS